MKSVGRNHWPGFLASAGGLLALLAALAVAAYIDLAVITLVYLPVLVSATILMLLGKRLLARALLTSAALGLLVEYVQHLAGGPSSPNMRGAFLNTAILIAGALVGIGAEVVSSRRGRLPS